MDTRVWRYAAGASIVVGAVYLWADSPIAMASVWLAALIAACGAMVVGVRMNRPDRLHPSVILLVAFVAITTSYALRFPLWVSPPTELIGDALLLIAYSLVSIAVLALVRLQAPGGDREGAIDGAIVLIAVATLLAGTVFDTSKLDADAGPLAWVVLIVAPLLLSAVAAATFRLLFVGTVRVPSAWMLVAAAAGAVAGNIVRTVQVSSGTYERGTWIDLLLLSSYVFVALAHLHPSVATLTRPSEPGSRRLTYARLTILGAALLAAPATLVMQEPGLGVSLPILSSVVLSLLVLWRLARLVIERELVRRALQERASRQEALAGIGRHALDEPDLDTLYDEVTSTCCRLLDLRTCRVLPSDAPAAPPDAVSLEIDPRAGALVAERDAAWNDEDLMFLRSAANILAGAVRRHHDAETMRHQALHDALTGLPNRLLIVDRIDHALARRSRADGTVVVLFLDLDGFKKVNDVYGHQAGDAVLVEVAARLRAHVRATDTVGRLAGDEFVVVCEDADERFARQVADRILAAVSEPFELSCGTVRVGISIGLAVASPEVTDAEQLLADADVALYQAKDKLGSAMVAFDRHVGQERDRRRHLELDLAMALEERQFHLVYQPLVAVDAAGRVRVIGAEALLRWDHPRWGTIPPLEFIPLADATGFILPLGDWVIEEAARQLGVWSADLPDAARFTLWVNLAARQLADRELPARVSRILAEAGASPARFGCEVTEGAILAEDAAVVIAALRSHGVQVALDDFGTGFSSLQHLRQLGLDAVKIDRSFVEGVTEAGGDRAVVRAVAALARELGVDVVGEGVETAAQLSALLELGCDLAQGYHLGRPAPAAQLTDRLAGEVQAPSRVAT